MAKFSKGSKADFQRNHVVKEESAVIIAEVKKGHPSQLQQYVIECADFGVKPDAVMEKMYKLDKKKKYLYVLESELHATGSIKKIQKEKNSKVKEIQDNSDAQREQLKTDLKKKSIERTKYFLDKKLKREKAVPKKKGKR